MRQLTRFEEEGTAKRFSEVLYVNGVSNRVSDDSGSFVVWVEDETLLDRSRALLAEYQREPEHPRFVEASRIARERRSAERRQEEKIRKRESQFVKRMERTPSGVGPVTLFLIAACIVVAVVTQLGEKRDVVSMLSFASPKGAFSVMIDRLTERGGGTGWKMSDSILSRFQDILSGEVWRVVTPIFLHFGFFHILFNMWWLKDLGTLIERVESSLRFAALVCFTAVVSNTAQYLVSGPFFGGMSGVVYGLFGYVWLRGRLDRRSVYSMPNSTVLIMLGFFFLCFTGAMGPIANTAHAAGLICGALWAGASTLLNRRNINP